ncbi:DUF5997 family protein [Leucobacter sp. Z1108]|uniref:DUF5997 family protein n=2 Tax=Leucobacter sp. Z1108 TaxID=3439066 RepID=UPI003F2FD1FB
MISQRELAQRLDISIEMVRRHGLPLHMTEEEFERFEANPPAWLVQSRANRTGNRPVWVELNCVICGFSEMTRPKKWWPDFTYLSCFEHHYSELPDMASGMRRMEVNGIGSRFIGVVDSPSETATD